MRCLFDSPATTCKQLKAFRGHGGLTLAARAHNSRKADGSRWYIVPSSEWPPFSFGRYFADWDPRLEGRMRIGAMVEKGLDQKVAPGLRKQAAKPLIAKRTWRWRDVVLENDSELLIEPIVTAAAKLAQPLDLVVEVRKIDGSISGDPYDCPPERTAKVYMEVDAQGSVQQVALEAENDVTPAPELAKAGSIDDVAKILRQASQDDWLFLSVLSGVSLMPAVDVSQVSRKAIKEIEKLRLLTTHELWESLLAPFEDWLVSVS